MPALELDVPAHVSPPRRALLDDLARTWDDAYGSDLLGIVLTGSVGRDRAGDSSDVDVHLVLSDDAAAAATVSRSEEVDEIPVGWSRLQQPGAFGTPAWWTRWSYAWAPVLLDRTGGRLGEALLRQASVDDEEARSVLVDHDRLDGWLNFAYRALKSDRAGREVERRLDAVESVPWFLDVVFTLAGRVRPYQGYLAWELEHHPLPGWADGELLGLVVATADGDPAALRTGFGRVRAACEAHDARTDAGLVGVIDDWGDQLALIEQG